MIHMIGHVYDPIIGRFCSADPIVQAPGNIQSYNRYSYCINNPLSLTDPTGYSWLSNAFNSVGNAFKSLGHAIANVAKSVSKWMAQNWRTVVASAAMMVSSAFTMGLLSPAIGAFWGTFAAGTIGGAVQGGVATALYGGSMTQILQNTLRGGIIGGATAAATFGIAHGMYGRSIFGEGGVGSTAWAETKAAEVGMQGGISELSGGDFKSGAIGALSSIVTGEILATNSAMVNSVMVAAAGGTVAELTGGNFANGAMSAGFTYLFNDAIQARQLGGQLPPNREDWFAFTIDSARGAIDDLLGYFYGPNVPTRSGGNLNEECLSNWQVLCSAPHSTDLYRGQLLTDIDRNSPALQNGIMVGYGFNENGQYKSQPTGNHAAYVRYSTSFFGLVGRYEFYHVFAGQPLVRGENLNPNLRGLNNPSLYNVLISAKSH